jgi:hypothetical protein
MAAPVIVEVALDKGRGNRFKVVVAPTPAADAAAAEYLRRVTEYTAGENYHVAHIDWDASQEATLGLCLDAVFYPKCEHGLRAQLCAGPQHYPYDAEERQAYGF